MKFDPIFDYGQSDLKNENNQICWKYGELIKTLITLASSADRQFEIMGFGIPTEEMAEDFHTYFVLSYQHYYNHNLLNEITIDKLHQINTFFNERSGGKDPDFWEDLALSTNKDWENVRRQAKEILILLGMDNLAIDFDRTEKYETTTEGKKLLIQTIRTRLTKI